MAAHFLRERWSGKSAVDDQSSRARPRASALGPGAREPGDALGERAVVVKEGQAQAVREGGRGRVHRAGHDGRRGAAPRARAPRRSGSAGAPRASARPTARVQDHSGSCLRSRAVRRS